MQRKDNWHYHKNRKSPTATKKGPGRVHQEGHKKQCRFGTPIAPGLF